MANSKEGFPRQRDFLGRAPPPQCMPQKKAHFSPTMHAPEENDLLVYMSSFKMNLPLCLKYRGNSTPIAE